jgi:hypothetical protein
MIDKEELAWASGIFDGEGSSGTYTAKGIYDTIHIELSVGQSDSFLVKRFHKITGEYGSINFSLKKNFYTLRVMRFEHVQYIMCLIWKRLGLIKREQYKKAVKFYLNSCWRPKFDRLSIYKREYDKYGSAAARDKAKWEKVFKDVVHGPFVNPFEKQNANINN